MKIGTEVLYKKLWTEPKFRGNIYKYSNVRTLPESTNETRLVRATVSFDVYKIRYRICPHERILPSWVGRKSFLEALQTLTHVPGYFMAAGK
jgi:hypothetical protein